jgi:DNA processing protein
MVLLQRKIALSLIPQIGPRLVRRLVAYAGSVDAVFDDRKVWISKIPGIGKGKASFFNKNELLKAAEQETEYTEKEGISVHFYLDDNYPRRLKECEDAPIVLFSKGGIDFNAEKIMSIVGTRNASDYGKSCTETIISALAASHPDLVIVSGLAYGIDITAHKAALKNNLKTIAALGHGMQFMYPAMHRKIAESIIRQGALVTEFKGDKKPDPGNFVSRNRIIAGLADATLIIESARKGGALITADIANSYNRDVFALPGRTTDHFSEGCNALIKTNKAALIENALDLELAMGWLDTKKKAVSAQKALFVELSPEEQKIISFLREKGEAYLDEISVFLDVSVGKVSANLLNLEFNGLVRSLPGKQYQAL